MLLHQHAATAARHGAVDSAAAAADALQQLYPAAAAAAAGVSAAAAAVAAGADGRQLCVWQHLLTMLQQPVMRAC